MINFYTWKKGARVGYGNWGDAMGSGRLGWGLFVEDGRGGVLGNRVVLGKKNRAHRGL